MRDYICNNITIKYLHKNLHGKRMCSRLSLLDSNTRTIMYKQNIGLILVPCPCLIYNKNRCYF